MPHSIVGDWYHSFVCLNGRIVLQLWSEPHQPYNYPMHGFQPKNVSAIRADAVVCVIKAGNLRAKAFQILFGRDGSLFVSFPYSLLQCCASARLADIMACRWLLLPPAMHLAGALGVTHTSMHSLREVRVQQVGDDSD